MKNPWIVLGLIAVVLVGGSVFYSNSQSNSSNEGVVLSPHIKGNTEATVTLTEYSDFQCPACAAFQPVLEDVFAQFGDSIKFEYKHFPLPMHPFAEPAARAAEAAAQQDAFFEFHDLLFANQQAWSNAANPTVFFYQYAETLGLDVDQFKRQYGASMFRTRIQEDAIEARGLGVTGTPTFFLNGERMVINTYEEFIEQIASAVGQPTQSTDVKFGI